MHITRISNLRLTRADDSSCVHKWMFIILILLPAMPLMAQQRELAPQRDIKILTIAGQDPRWHVIDDAPYRVIPAHPQLKPNGETIKELCFDSIETLLSRNHTEDRQTIDVDMKSPKLEWQRALLEQDGKSLNIEFQNIVTAALRDFTLDLYAQVAGKRQGMFLENRTELRRQVDRLREGDP